MGRAPTQTRHKLIETATELIWRNSYNAVSVDEICAQANVKKGSFYHYFPSKADLALATMDWCMEETKAQYDDIFSATRPATERFAMMVEHIINQQEEKYTQLGQVCGCPFATLGTELAAQDAVIGQKINDICAKKSAYYEQALRDLVAEGAISPSTNIKQKAEEIFAFVVGQLIMARISNNLSSIKDHLQQSLFDLIGIQPQEKLTTRSTKTHVLETQP